MAEAATIQQLERQSVQALPDAEKGTTLALPWFSTGRGFILPPYGTRQRERALRTFYRHEYNYMGQSAISGLIAKIAATKWRIKASRREEYFSDVLRNADFYRGWSTFLSKFLVDFLTLDGGAYAEVIAPGNPKRPPTGAIAGIAALDALQCIPTGDPEFPVLYTNNDGQTRLLHYTRVIHMVDTPVSAATNPGYGQSALCRAISIVAREIYMGRYVETKLDDKPAPGYTVFNNINRQEYDAIMAMYRIQQSNDAMPEWGRNINVFSLDPSRPVDIKHVTNSQSPESWSYVDYTQLDVNAWALALGVDVQELWQLSGGNLGSGQQSQVLHAKSQGKTQALIYQSLSRIINLLLPGYAEFEFVPDDPFKSESDAKIATAWAGFVSSVSSTLTALEQRQLLASKVEAYADIVTDADGQVLELTDIDVEPKIETVTPAPTAEPAAGVQTDEAPADIAPDEENVADSEKAVKALQATRLDFEDDWNDLIAAAREDDMTRRRFGIVARALITKYGRRAYEDGLEEGGIEDAELDDSDRAKILALSAEQSAYVTGIGATLFRGDGISDLEAAKKPEMWFNKSIVPYFDAGLLSADRNGLYEWTLGATEEHCTDCSRLEGQRHRLKDYHRTGWIPKASKLSCHGFNCGCGLKRTSGRAAGSY